MIVNFYKTHDESLKSATLLVSKNINYIPQKGTFITFSGQLFAISKICFNVDNCEYNIYIVRS